MSAPDLSLVILSYNTEALLRECLDSVFACTRGCSFEVIVVDNASRDGSVAMLRRDYPQVRLVESPDNLGFGGGNNLGVEHAAGEYIVFLNSDAVLRYDTCLELVDCLRARPDVACVGPRVVGSDGLPQMQAWGHLPSPWRLLMQAIGGARLRLPAFEGVDGVRRGSGEWTVGWLSGVCIAVRREQFRAVGGFDRRFFMYAEDVALCGRLRRFGRSLLLDRADVLHYGGGSSGNRASRVRNAVWQQRHILQVCEDEFGPGARLLGGAAVGFGLLLRLAASLLRVPRDGIAGNLLLATTMARLADLMGRRTIPERPVDSAAVKG